MKNGDLVIGIPIETDSEEDVLPESVTGTLEITPVSFMGEKWNLVQVYVEDSEGDTVPVEVEENSLREAGRRDKVTVLS